MNKNNCVTRSQIANMVKGKTAPQTSTTTAEQPTFKRSREDLDDPVDVDDTYSDLLAKMKKMIDEGNERIEAKIEKGNCALSELKEDIGSLRNEVQKLREDCTRDINQLAENATTTEAKVIANKEAIARLEKSTDLLLTGVSYNPSEKTSVFVSKAATVLGYCDQDVPVVFSKRLARVPIADGATPPILLQFAVKGARDDFLFRYLERKNLNLIHLGFEVGKRIFLNENLSDSARKLKGDALKLKKDGRIKTVFTRNGVVHVKSKDDIPAQPIFNQDQLDTFKK